eukprot:UC1_evm1s429
MASGGAVVTSAMAVDQEEYSIAEIAQLIDNVKHADLELRLAALQELPVIARALGPVRTRAELLPFLRDSIDDEEEVLAVMADQLRELIPLVGGAEHVVSLLPLLETLVSAEDSDVRTRAVGALNAVVQHLPSPDVSSAYLPLVQRMATNQWFTVRAAACGTLAALFSLVVADAQAELVEAYRVLASDSVPMVRRAAAAALKDLVGVMPASSLEEVTYPLWASLTEDEQDNTRIQVAACLPVFVTAYTTAAAAASVEGGASGGEAAAAAAMASMEKVLPVLHTCAADSSWRVRYMLADVMDALQEASPSPVVMSELLPKFIGLMRDGESEVRTCIAGKVLGFCKGLPESTRIETVITHVLPCIQEQASDDSEHVRAAIAPAIMGLPPIVGKNLTIEHFLPLCLQMLKDPNPDVRLNVISNLDAINSVIGAAHLSESLLPAIFELAEDGEWRIRLRIIDYIPLVTKQLGADFYSQQLMEQSLVWLRDPVHAVRLAAVNNLRDLTDLFGVDWAKGTIVPLVMGLAENEHHTHRMTTLFATNALAPFCNPILTFLNSKGSFLLFLAFTP